MASESLHCVNPHVCMCAASTMHVSVLGDVNHTCVHTQLIWRVHTCVFMHGTCNAHTCAHVIALSCTGM